MKIAESVNVLEAYRRYVTYLQGLGRSPDTLKSYDEQLSPFFRFLQGESVTEIEGITVELLDVYAAGLRERTEQFLDHPYRSSIEKPLSESTIASRVRVVKIFLRWLYVRGYTPTHLGQHLTISRPRHDSDRRVMSRRDFYRMLDEVTRTATEEGNVRDLALFMFAADTGCRRGEIARLTMQDLNLEKREAKVTGKGRPLVVDFTPKTADVLSIWLNLRENMINGRDHGVVFVGINPMHGRSYGQPLTPAGVSEVFRRLGKRAGVKGRCNPHSLRHLVGQTWADQFSLALVQEKLGHSDITTTARFYAHQDRSRVKAATDVASLVNNWRPEQ